MSLMTNILDAADHRPYPLPPGQWRMGQRWSDLLFAHWPVAAEEIARLLPPDLAVDAFDGYAWVGVVPFWMDQVRTRTVGQSTIVVPGTGAFCELNLRTYVRSKISDLAGVFFFSLDAASALAVLGARVFFHLPYFWASMRRQIGADGTIAYDSTRLLTRGNVRFQARYRGLGEIAAPSTPGSLEYFLTARFCLFTAHAGRLRIGHIHHLPWPLQRAEAEIERNELPAAHGIRLPRRAPVLHFARELHVFIWSLREDEAASSYNASAASFGGS